MSDTNGSIENSSAERNETIGSDASPSIESYPTDDGIVFHDSKNPLAWIETDHAVDLDSSA